MKKHLGLGRDHTEYGSCSAETIGEGIVGLISVGADPSSPSLVYKGDSEFPNEDAYFVGMDGQWVILAVADAHYGPEASEAIVSRLSQDCNRIPQSPGELALLLLGLFHEPWESKSATTLVVTVFNRSTGEGFGYSWGDSSVLALGTSSVNQLNQHNETYIGPETIPDLAGASFQFNVPAGSFLLAFTDGINECHYRSPLTSVTEMHLLATHQQVLESTPPAEEQSLLLGQAVMQLALTGVDGHPGGQDNIALVVIGPAG